MTYPADGSQQPTDDAAASFAYRSERRRFVKAFTELSDRMRRPGQLTVRPMVVAVVVVAALAAGFAVGAVPHLLHSGSSTGNVIPVGVPVSSATPVASGTPGDRGSPPATFTAVTGYGCSQSPAASFADFGWFSQGLVGFLLIHSSSITADGCTGAFLAMPMSGSQTSDDPENYALWTFHPTTGPAARSLKCQVDVYVPRDTNIEHVGGNPAFYQVFESAGRNGPLLGSFNIDQRAHHGVWASGGSYHVSGGALTVEADSRGVDWVDNTPTHAHIALAAVRLRCQAP